MSLPAHKSVLLPLKSLKEADYNPRMMPPSEMASLVKSLKEFGFVEPVIARAEDGLVIGGHQRLAAFRTLLLEQGTPVLDVEKQKVPVVQVTGVSDEKAKVLNLALNKISGRWDFDKLNSVLADLKSVADLDLTLTGFDVMEIDDLLNLSRMPLDHKDSEGSSPEPSREVVPTSSLRTFSFTVASEEEGKLCKEVLEHFDPKNESSAFFQLCQFASDTLAETEEE